MVQQAEVICNPEGKTGLDTEACKVGMAGTFIGMIAYIFLVVPILTLTVVGVMNLSDGYGVAVAIAFVITGLYVTEKFACLNV
jgi:hypothetical protein